MQNEVTKYPLTGAHFTSNHHRQLLTCTFSPGHEPVLEQKGHTTYILGVTTGES